MSEMRRDPIVGQWAVVHTDDSWLPGQYERQDQTPRRQATCQFCPGRERQTPSEIEAVRHNGSHPNAPEWNVRVVPNKFPALKIEGGIDARQQGIFDCSNGVGAHEVVIENPDHFKNLADYSQQEIIDVIDKYQSRLNDLTKDNRFKYIVIFRNFGESAGATVEHAHSQIIALPMVPKYVSQELKGVKKYYEAHQRCVYCDIIQQEYREQERIVAENEMFIALSPFVPRYSFECWILPKRHDSEFAHLSVFEKNGLAAMLKDVLSRIKLCLANPSYNYYLHIKPVNDPESQEISYHWHIEIVPQLYAASGFEWGSGFYVVRTSPESAARFLRESVV